MAKNLDVLDCVPPDLARRLHKLPATERAEMIQDLKKALEEFHANKDLCQLSAHSPQAVLASSIYRGLLSGFFNVVAAEGHQREAHLDIWQVAEFLAWLATCETVRLPWVVKSGLEHLGISRQLPRRGRPRGATTGLDYAIAVETVIRVIADSGLWDKKLAFKKKYRSNWYERFRRALAKDGVSAELANLLTRQKTPRSVAIYLTAERYHVEYDAVARALARRRVKPDKN